MSTSTEVIDFSDLQTDFINRTRGSTTQASTVLLAKRYLNTALRDIHIVPGNKFPWQFRRGVLVTNAPYSTGTVSIAAATRTLVTGSSTLWNTAVTGFGVNNVQVGGKMTFNGMNEVYDVSVVTSDTQLTLSTRYTGDALTASAYTYFEDEYALPADFHEFVDVRMFSTDMNIPLMGSMEFRRRYPRNDITGRPRVATHIQLGFATTTAPRHRVIFNPAPDDQYSIPYWYVTTNLAVTSAGVEQARMTSDSDEPIVPVQFRSAIVLHALYNFYRDYKDDVRSQEAKAEYTDMMVRVAGQREMGTDRPQLVARIHGNYSAPRRFDYNGHFDKLDF